MNKRRLKLDFFAILHPLFLIMLGLLFYLFAFILIWFINGLVEMIQGKMDFHTLYFYSLVFSTIYYVCSWFHSSTHYSSLSSKGKNASTGLVHAYGCPGASASL